MANHAKNHFQFERDIPVSRYKHVVKPIRGISERFFMNAKTQRTRQVSQKIIVEICNVFLADKASVSNSWIFAGEGDSIDAIAACDSPSVRSKWNRFWK